MIDTFDKHPISLEDYEMSYILLLFLLYSILLNSLKIDNLYMLQMVNIKPENMINQNIRFSIKHVIDTIIIFTLAESAPFLSVTVLILKAHLLPS